MLVCGNYAYKERILEYLIGPRYHNAGFVNQQLNLKEVAMMGSGRITINGATTEMIKALLSDPAFKTADGHISITIEPDLKSREAANKKLADAKIDVNSISDNEKKMIIINNATDVADLAHYFSKNKSYNWFNDLLEFQPERLVSILKRTGAVKEVLNILADSGYPHPLATLRAIEPNYCDLFLDHYNGMKRLLDYKINLTFLRKMPISKLSIMLKEYNGCGELLKTFEELRYPNPLKVLLDLKEEDLLKIFENKTAAIEFIKYFNSAGYTLYHLFRLEDNERKFFYENHTRVIEFMKEIAKSGLSNNPLKYLLLEGGLETIKTKGQMLR